MKTFRLTLVLIFLGASLHAQDAGPPPPVSVADAAVVPPGFTAAVQRTPQELDQLLAPIALYPDALIALILPAATVPTDIVLAARHLRDNPGDSSQIEHRAWDESVKSLTHYPDVVKWMDENLHWTKQVGEAFAEQPAEVMQAVQRLRAQARAAGTLVDTPQQQVLAEAQVIRIVPAQADIIYVPYYEPEIVFVDRPYYYTRPFLTFGIGVPVGSWLAFDCDWRHNTIWVGNRHRRWTGHDWRRPLVPFAPGPSFTRTPNVRQWRPPPTARPPFSVGHRYRTEIARPVPIAITTSRSYPHRNPGSSDRRQELNAPPAINPLTQSFRSSPRSEYPGPRAPSAPVAPAIDAASVNGPAASAPKVQPPPQSRRNTGDGSRDSDSRSRGTRSSQANTTSPLPVVPSLPMATPDSNPQPMGPTPPRSYSRATPPPAAAPAVVPSLPMTSRSAPPASVAPATQRTYSRATPSPAAAPAVVPSLPMASRSAPAATVAPASPAPAPAAQPAAQRGGGGENRGNRSGGGRRDDP